MAFCVSSSRFSTASSSSLLLESDPPLPPLARESLGPSSCGGSFDLSSSASRGGRCSIACAVAGRASSRGCERCASGDVGAARRVLSALNGLPQTTSPLVSRLALSSSGSSGRELTEEAVEAEEVGGRADKAVAKRSEADAGSLLLVSRGVVGKEDWRSTLDEEAADVEVEDTTERSCMRFCALVGRSALPGR